MAKPPISAPPSGGSGEETPYGVTMPTGDASCGLDRLSALELADLSLTALVRRKAAAVQLGPAGARHALRAEQGDATITVGTLDPELGDAAVARLAILAGLDVSAPSEQVGRLKVKLASGKSTTPTVELLVVVRAAPAGLSAELRRLVSADDDLEAVSPLLPQAAGSHAGEGTLVGKYRILDEIGRGGMGVVFRGEHVVLQKPVAIKVLHPGLAQRPLLAARFVVEARAACRARHPGIVDVTDFGRLPDGRAFLVMELMEGLTLDALLRQGPLAPQRALALAEQICVALGAASAHGVVHRDLKPANIFVGKGDQVKIGDFGVALVLDEGGAPVAEIKNSIVGTAGYMAPEQARGEGADVRSDLYALGCVLYEMLTGQLPYPNLAISDIASREAPPPVPVVSPAEGPLPDVVHEVLTRALARKREERYQNADEMLADLQRAGRALARPGWRRWLPA